jgi:hypothetical protein
MNFYLLLFYGILFGRFSVLRVFVVFMVAFS